MPELDVCAIVAVAHDGAMGLNGDLPWPRLKHDMRHFHVQTVGASVIMGRRTWESLPTRPLVGRYNIVLTRDPQWAPTVSPFGPDAVFDVVHSPEDALAVAATKGSSRAYVIGGRQVYDAFWPRLRSIWLTKVDLESIKADTYFPYPLSPREWKCVWDGPIRVDECVRYSIHRYERV